METSNSTAPVENIGPPAEEQRKSAAADLVSLSRVSHRLALIDTSEKLQTVLDKLLPRLLQRIGDNNQIQRSTNDDVLRETLSKIHLKLVEMMSHIMKRVKDDKNCKLNTYEIIERLLDRQNSPDQEYPTAKDCDSFSLNLSLAFLTVAVPRCNSKELESILPGLLILNAQYEIRVEEEIMLSSPSSSSTTSAKKQWHQVSHLLLRTLELTILEEETALKRTIGSRTNSCQETSGGHNKRVKHDTEEKKKDSSSNGLDSNSLGNYSKKHGLELARQLLAQDARIAGACYELFLDALLYQTEAGNVPPPGLSSAGWERLKSGHSSTERDWGAEMAPRSRLCDFKTRLLEWIAPSRRWGLFTVDVSSADASEGRDGLSISYLHGLSRSLALLVTASGDSMQGVTEPAKQYLKQHWDSRRDKGGGFGDTGILTKELLGLSVGGINAQMVLSSSSSTSAVDATRSNSIPALDNDSLGMIHVDIAFRRRQVSDTNFSELVGTATKAIEELQGADVCAIGKLAILATDKMLSKLRNSLGLTLLRGKPYIAAAELLNSVVVRLEKTEDREVDELSRWSMDARALALAAAALAPTAASPALSTGAISEANVAVRDSIYGTISVICRSSFAKERFLVLMAAGNLEVNTLSIDLFQLLLSCIGNEVDKLRPRATSALDALLSACRRAVEGSDEAMNVQKQHIASNPWGQVEPSVGVHQTTIPDSSPTILAADLSKSLLPSLWNASRKSQTRQVRVAAARWSSDLLIDLDIASATHLLCFLAGDSDATASGIAREGLRLDTSKLVKIPDFADLVGVLLVEAVESTSRPTFWDFSDKGKSVGVRCLLRSYLDDFHGGGDNDIRSFVDALTKCLAWKDDVSRSDSLLDACSEALCVCLETSATARSMLHSSALSLDVEGLRDLIVTSKSSRARRHLSDAFGHMLMDVSIFDSRWIEVVKDSLSFSARFVEAEPIRPSVDTHGGALLGGTCVRLCRLNHRLVDSLGWSQASRVLRRLSEGVANADDSIGNVFCDAISLACTGESIACNINDRYVRSRASQNLSVMPRDFTFLFSSSAA